MNKIEKLINQLCPDGVEFKELGELLNKKIISTIIPPKKLTKKYYQKKGAFPIIDQGQKYIIGYIDNEDITVKKGEYVIFGDHTEIIKYINFPFVQGADGIKILKSDKINTKYLYYAINVFYKKIGKYTRHFNLLKKLKIPIPPLSVQEEIVKILDNFTELEAELKAELEAELEARKQQYEYYREQLLNFEGDEVEWKKLGEVCDIVDNKRKPIKSSLRIKGDIPYYGANNIQDYVEGFTHNGEYILLAEDGSASLEAYSVQYVNGKFWANNHVHVIKGKAGALNKFLFHWFKNMNFIPYLTGRTRAKLTKGKMLKIKIPIPPIEKQKQIVAILDKFDALVNDISQGIPAEIKARRQQYEYYRKKLLTFKEKEECNK